MASNKTHGISHQLIREFDAACFGTNGSGLHGNPFLKHAQHIMPPHNIRLQYLARARIEDRRPHRISFGRSGISQHRIINIVHIHSHAIGDFLCKDGVFESCTFKSYLPVFDTLLYVFSPTIGSRVLNIENNRFGRFDKFTAQITFAILRFGLQTPTGNELFLIHPLLSVTVIQQRISEVTYARIIQTTDHRCFRQQHE